MKLAILGACALALAACSPSAQNRLAAGVQFGQLVCLNPQGAAAMVDPADAPVLAQGKPKAFVDAACALVDGIAVSPPGGAVRTLTITPPPVTVSLGK